MCEYQTVCPMYGKRRCKEDCELISTWDYIKNWKEKYDDEDERTRIEIAERVGRAD
jgi:hypothetical protein